MRVVVVGHRGSGKTALVAQALDGVRALAGERARMSPVDRWRLHRTTARLAAGRPIGATRTPRVASLALTAGDQASAGPGLSVTVHDHPGRAVGAGPTGLARRLETDLAQADGIFMVISQEDLMSARSRRLSRCRSLVVPVRRALLAARAGPAGPGGIQSVVIVVTRAGRRPAVGELAMLATPFDGLETSASAVIAGATVALDDDPAPPHAALPLLWCLDRWVSQAGGAVTAGWQATTSAWFRAAWDAAEDTGRYAWLPYRERRVP